MILSENLPTDTEVEITYFIPDEKKDGGKYLTVTGSVKKILEFERLVIMQSGEKIPGSKIVSIEGELIREIDEGVI